MTIEEFKSYLDYIEYMEEYEKEHGNYPMELSNEQWVPYSNYEFNKLRNQD